MPAKPLYKAQRPAALYLHDLDPLEMDREQTREACVRRHVPVGGAVEQNGCHYLQSHMVALQQQRYL